jgi:predicted lipase
MKSILTILFILIVGTTFSQTKAQQDSARIAAATPILSQNDMDQVMIYLDDKLLAKDHRLVLNTIREAIIQARKRKKP